MKDPEPCKQKCRATDVVSALYLMGDASGQGFGSGLWNKEGLWYESAEWSEECKQETSNWKEANNLTTALENKAAEGRLQGADVFIFTDNMVFESTF